MIRPPEIKLRIFYALLGDAISRVFNLLRIVFSLCFLVSIVITARQVNHFHDLTWVMDFAAGGVLASKLGRWLRIEF